MVNHYGELTQLFDAWRNKWTEQYRAYQFLPWNVANAFRTFLGCPEYYYEDGITRSKRIRYVSPTKAVWDQENGVFQLSAYENSIEDVYFHDDGYCYFGLRAILEHGPQTYPKLPFWFLLRAKIENENCEITEQRTEKVFEIRAGSEKPFHDLCYHIFDLLKADLSETPIEQTLRHRKEKFRVGFTDMD